MEQCVMIPSNGVYCSLSLRKGFCSAKNIGLGVCVCGLLWASSW